VNEPGTLNALSFEKFDKYGRATLIFRLGFYPSGLTRASHGKGVLFTTNLL
jgi:hypothetical protein